MKQWKLWTSVASGLLSVGGGSGYYFWNRTPASEPVEAAAAPEETSPHAIPPQPIPDPNPRSEPSPTRFATPVSFNEPVAEEANSGGYGGGRYGAGRFGADGSVGDTVPVQPKFDEPRYGGQPTAEPATTAETESPPERASLTDMESPPAVPPSGTETDPPGQSEFAPMAAESTRPDAVPPATPGQESAGEAANLPAPVPTANEAVQQPSSVPGGSPAKSPPAEAPPVAMPPVPKPSAEKSPAPVPRPFAEVTPPSVPAAKPDTRPFPNRFNTPVAPSLRSNTAVDRGVRGAEPPATLPGTEATISETPAPGFAQAPSPVLNSRPGSRAKAPSANPRDISRVSNAPGERKLEGLQSPSLTVEGSLPEEIQVGRPAKCVIRVRNVGQVTAQDVVVSDRVPQGTQFLAAIPETAPTADGVVIWELGALQPGEESTVTLELMPQAEGEIGSVAEVTFRAQAAVRTIATKPLLKVDHSGPTKVLIGEEVPIQITVSNPGSGVASGVVIEVDVPEGLAHDGGREIMSDRFELRPNETHKVDLVLRAVEAGLVQSIVRVVGENNLKAESRSQVEIVAPQLQAGVVGPTRRFLDRPVKYQITLDNPGTAPAKEIELVARLPRGLKYISADKKGQYDQRQHAVTWSLEELPAGERGVVELTALPTDTGEQKLHIESRAALGLEHQHDHTTVVEDITDLVFTVTDENVPIEVGSETTYQIKVANNGTKVARNVRLAIQVPEGLSVIDFDGPTQIQQQAAQLVMQPIAELGQREEAVYRITAKGILPGDHVLRVQLLSDEFSSPVTKEEITKVYADK